MLILFDLGIVVNVAALPLLKVKLLSKVENNEVN